MGSHILVSMRNERESTTALANTLITDVITEADELIMVELRIAFLPHADMT
jgi:hypothetical protein